MPDGPRLIVVGLDGFETAIADKLIESGRLPAFRKLREKGLQFRLDHGNARETGLAWEHFSTGKHPESYARWSAVEFNPETYSATQVKTRTEPFLATVDIPVLAFDVPYLDLSRTLSAVGMSNWGAHDPGVERATLPPELDAEITKRFGDYPAREYIYGFVWPSPESTEDMACKLIEATRRRAKIMRWLAGKRLPDWRIAMTVVAELHSALEALWHGWDESHPLHGLPSTEAARRGIEGVYEQTDALIAGLHADHPDAELIAFSHHGMGPNQADLPSMVLLPELLYRRKFGHRFLHPRKDWLQHPPLLEGNEQWSHAINTRLGILGPQASQNGFVHRLHQRAEAFARRIKSSDVKIELDWMPAARYAPFWPRMEAFALPAYYDGQIRVNLKGRERDGFVPAERYPALLDELEKLILSVRDPRSGEPVARRIDRPLAANPFSQTETRCDLKILWARNVYAFDVPGMGRIGPVPQRRTGGHTGDFGYAYILGTTRSRKAGTVASSFDIVPTLLSMAGAEAPPGLSGRSLVR